MNYVAIINSSQPRKLGIHQPLNWRIYGNVLVNVHECC